jgi:hypothetical protein
VVFPNAAAGTNPNGRVQSVGCVGAKYGITMTEHKRFYAL